MKPTKLFILMALFVVLTVSYDQLNENHEIMMFYERYSFMPIVHVYYNRHFSKSKQFQQFLDVIEEAEYEISSYAKILLTDCEDQKDEQTTACKEIERLNENRVILGQQPNSKFTSFGDKVMQSPPQNKMFDHFSDVYTVEQIVRFVNQLVPNFLKDVRNLNEFEDFKQPMYSPKLIFAGEEGQIPQVIKQLSVQFFLRFDMAFVEDLTESIVNQLQLRKFPALLVLKHNFQNGKLQIFHYDSYDFSQDQSQRIRKFLNKYALPEKRSDYVFHLIKAPSQAEIITVDNKALLDQTLDRIKSWTFVQQGPSFDKLVDMKQKYGLYYDYIHYLRPQLEQEKMTLINTRSRVSIDYMNQQLKYRQMNADDFQTNSTIWLKKDYVVVGVRQEYGHICTLVNRPLFSGLVQCFVIAQDSYEDVKKNLVPFTYGLIVYANKTSGKIQGNDIKTLDFQTNYRSLQFSTRMKVKEIIDDFLENPVKGLVQSTDVQDLCAEPYKKCILYFSERAQDKTRRQYLELQAINFVNEYKIYEIDLQCNKHIYEEIPQFKQSGGGLIAYHPKLNKFVFLKAKMTRNAIKKFMQINNEQKKTLPFRSFSADRIPLNFCEDTPQAQEETFNQQQYGQQL